MKKRIKKVKRQKTKRQKIKKQKIKRIKVKRQKVKEKKVKKQKVEKIKVKKYKKPIKKYKRKKKVVEDFYIKGKPDFRKKNKINIYVKGKLYASINLKDEIVNFYKDNKVISSQKINIKRAKRKDLYLQKIINDIKTEVFEKEIKIGEGEKYQVELSNGKKTEYYKKISESKMRQCEEYTFEISGYNFQEVLQAIDIEKYYLKPEYKDVRVVFKIMFNDKEGRPAGYVYKGEKYKMTRVMTNDLKSRIKKDVEEWGKRLRVNVVNWLYYSMKRQIDYLGWSFTPKSQRRYDYYKKTKEGKIKRCTGKYQQGLETIKRAFAYLKICYKK